ncbi:High affinity immunoglobulin epsilon receptor subunit gamma Fc receptor gamma-chain [Takifugu flavidus]|nr:High affinity immunoglobulin epsilon receptor subunit gamma Fc receptor gamma-chain [Takifugu flavidus]
MALGKNLMFVAILLFLNFGTAAAITDPQICYILDGILFLYGIILSALYCRIKGLAPHEQSTYETIGQKK